MSENFKFCCPYCGQKYDVDVQYVGWTLTCQSCSKEITVPSPDDNEDAEDREYFFDAVENLEDHEAITDGDAVKREYGEIPESVREDANSLINWIEKNRPELVSVKYSRAGSEFVEAGQEEFKERIVYVCEHIFPAPVGDPPMSREQIRELYDLGFTALQYIAGKSRYQTQYVINYWTALKEYFDILSESFYDDFFVMGVIPRKGKFFAGFEESEQALHAYRTRTGIRCHACGYEGSDKRGRCPVCGTKIQEIS